MRLVDLLLFAFFVPVFAQDQGDLFKVGVILGTLGGVIFILGLLGCVAYCCVYRPPFSRRQKEDYVVDVMPKNQRPVKVIQKIPDFDYSPPPTKQMNGDFVQFTRGSLDDFGHMPDSVLRKETYDPYPIDGRHFGSSV